MSFVHTDITLCRAPWGLLKLILHCVGLLGFLLVLAVPCVVLFCFVDTDIAFCRAAWVLLVQTEDCVWLLGFCS